MKNNPQWNAVSVGRLTKEIMEINPHLGVQEIIEVIQKSSRIVAGVRTIDEAHACEYARALFSTRFLRQGKEQSTLPPDWIPDEDGRVALCPEELRSN